MVKNILEAVLIVGVPIIILVGSGWLMLEVSGRNEIMAQKGDDLPKSLNSRPFGYEVKDVSEYWIKLGPSGRAAEMRFLRMDLLYPILYCAALALGLFIAWERLGFKISILPLLLIVLFILFSDLTENLIHINQLENVIENESYVLRPLLIQIASLATILKLWLLVALGTGLLVLSGMICIGFSKQIS